MYQYSINRGVNIALRHISMEWKMLAGILFEKKVTAERPFKPDFH